MYNVAVGILLTVTIIWKYAYVISHRVHSRASRAVTLDFGPHMNVGNGYIVIIIITRGMCVCIM